MFDAELAAIDAVLARAEAVLKTEAEPTSRSRDRNPLVYDLDWDEDARLEEWRAVLRHADNLPPVLQYAPWLGRHLTASILRQAGVTTDSYLAVINLGLKSIPVDRRRHRSREARLLAIADALIATAEFGLKEYDRLALARKMMERELQGRLVCKRPVRPFLTDLAGSTAGVRRSG